VKPRFLEDFKQATLINAKSRIREPGCQLSIDEYSLGGYNSVRICKDAPMWLGYFYAGYRLRLK
jgi:hypothetical protein